MRSTGDIDIWVEVSSENAARVTEAVRDFGFNVPALSLHLFLERDKIIRLGVPTFRIELMTGISGVDFKECHQERVMTDLDGLPVPIISLTHLKKNKRAAGRLKGLADLEQLP